MNYLPEIGQRVTLKVHGNNHVHTVTVVRIGKRRISCMIDAHTSEAGYHYPARVRAYEFATFRAEWRNAMESAK